MLRDKTIPEPQNRFTKERFDLVDSIVSKLNRSQDLANEAKDILLQLEKSPDKILQGKTPKVVAVAAIRIAGLLSGTQIIYRELCGASNIHECDSLHYFVKECADELGFRQEKHSGRNGTRVQLLRK